MAVPALMLPGAAQFALASMSNSGSARASKAAWAAARALSGNMDLLVALGTTAAGAFHLDLAGNRPRPRTLFRISRRC